MFTGNDRTSRKRKVREVGRKGVEGGNNGVQEKTNRCRIVALMRETKFSYVFLLVNFVSTPLGRKQRVDNIKAE